MLKHIFFDRDGTLGELTDIRFPNTFIPFKNINSTFDKLHKLGYKVYIFSNQSSIARGTAGNYDFAKEFLNYGTDDWFVCPHDNIDNCNCRKPKNGLLMQAKQKYNLNFNDCLVVGDRWSDLDCGLSVGTQAVLVRTGKGKATEESDTFLFNRHKILAVINDFTYITEVLNLKI